MADNPFSPTGAGVVNDNPYTPLETGSLGGGGALNTLAGMAASSRPAMPAPPVPTTPQVFYSPSQNKMFVNGALFDADDAQSALDSVPYITQPPTAPPAGYDWQEVTPATYDEYIGNINDPSFGTLMARNFEIGGSNLKLLAGRGAQFLGAEETGQGWVNSALTELYKNQPYQREFTSIEEVSGTSQSHGAIDWFVANLAQQGPMLIESLATAIAGAGVGAVVGGGANPFTATGGAISALMGKESFKRGVLIAARKYMNGQALTNGEKKLLRELAGWTGAVARRNPNALATPAQLARLGRQEADALLTGAQLATRGGRNQAMVGGAFLGNLGGSYALGVADIYGEVRDTGVGDRFTAALGAIPYAALETLPEFLLAGRILGLDGSVLSPARMSSGGVASRFGKGFAVGGTLEGLTEAGQEAILLSSTGQMGDAEAGKRLINAFAAGFAVGGPLGGVANLRRGEPTNMLNPDAPAQQGTGLAPINPDNPNPGPLEGELLGPEVPPAPDALPPSGGTALPPPTPPVQQVGQQPDFVAGSEGVRPGTPNDTPVQINTPVIPAAQSGQQGLINVFGDQPTTGTEVQARMEPAAENNTVEQALSQPQQPVQQDLPGFEPYQQQELPLEDPIVQQARLTSTQPEAQTAMGQELLRAAQARDVQQRQETQQAIQEAAIARQQLQEERLRAERQRQFDAAMMQRQEQQIKELETARIEQILAENERLTQENIQLKAPPAPLAQPVQQSLPGFGVPYGQKVLQRRQEATQQVAPAPVQQRPDPRQLELPLFADEAELDGMNIVRLKNVARSLGVTGYSNVKKPVLLEKIKEKLREGQQDAVQEPSTTRVDVQEQPETSQAVRVGDTQGQQATAAPRGAERLRATQDSTTERGEAQVAATTGQDQTEAAVQQPTDSTQQTRQQDSQEDANLDTTYDTVADAWEDMGVTNAPLDKLPDAQRQKFEDLVNSGAVTYEQTKAIYEEARPYMQLTALQELQEAMYIMDTTTDKTAMEYAAESIMDVAFFDTNSNLDTKTAGGNPSVRDQALAYIWNTQFSKKQRDILNNRFVYLANLNNSLKGTYDKGKTKKGEAKPWAMYAAHANLFDLIKAEMKDMPAFYSEKQEAVTGETVAAAEQDQVTDEPAADDNKQEEPSLSEEERRLFNSQALEERISSHLAGWPTTAITDTKLNVTKDGTLTEKGRLEEMFANADPEYRTARGPKLKDFFTEDGTLKLRKASGTDQVGYVPTTKVLTAEEKAQARQDIKEAKAAARLKEKERLRDLRQMMGEDDRGSIFDSFDDGLDGMYYRADGEKVKNPVPKGKIRLIVNKLLKSLKVKPKVTVVDNFEDLRVNHPELYARAAKGRPDFGQVNAIGYSIGDEIIIFADFAQSEQSVKFVVAHETLGHFGFRAFMPRDRLGAIFRSIYKTDPHIRNAANRKAEAGMSLEEAVEEALADAAAVLDSSVIKRVWYAVKSFLNNLGMTFSDDMARYLIRQSRRNLRTGGRGVVGGKQLAQNLKDMADESTYGRYSVEEDRADLASKFFETFGTNKRTGPYGGFTGFRNLYKRIKANPSDIANLVGEALERVQSLDNMASRSEGLSAVFKIFQDQQALVKRLHAEYEKLTAFSHTPNFFGTGKGPTPAELKLAGEMLAYAALYKGRITTEKMIRDMPNLAYTNENGETVIDYRVFDEAVAAGELTQAEFDAGIEVTLDIVDGAENTDPEIYRPVYEDKDGNPVNRENVWRIYQEQRKAINQASLDVLQANLEASMDQKNEALEGFKNMTGEGGNAPTSVEIQTLKRIIEEYTRLYKENAVEEGSGRRYNADSVKRAEDFIEEINKAIHNPLKVNDWKTGNPEEKASQFQGERFQDIIDGLERLNGLGMSQNQAYKITNTIQNIYLLDVRNQNAEFLAKRTIMGAYIPFTRRGKYQVIVKAVDADGKVISLDEAYKSSMPYFQVDSREDARDIQRDLDETFGNRTYKVLDGDSKTREVTFVAEYGVARQSQPLTHSVNLSEIIDVLSRLNVNITPKERERLVVSLTRQGERARRSLQRSGVPGWNEDVVRSISEHLETAGHIAGKTRFRHRLNRIMLDDSMWRGNPEKLKRLEEAMLRAERSGNQERIKIARQEYDAYASMYQYSADVGAKKKVNLYSEHLGGLTGKFIPERKSKEVSTEGRGEVYREEAKRLLAWYSDAANIDQSTEDLLSGEVGSRFKLYAVLFQLGGSFATAFINAISMVTHSIPYLSTYNPYRGYGGGFGITNSAAAMGRASWTMKDPKLADYAYVNDVANSADLQQQHGLTQDEAEALRDATAEGVLQAAQFNALVGTARGGVKSNQWSAAIKTWMGMFSFTEQLNRRSTYLAAYRLERDKQLAAGATQAEAQERAAEFGRKAVNTSQGEYAMYNRPEMARGNLFQYIFMYKQFVIVTVQLMKGLAPKERAMMLGLLIFMSGIKGLPFADDLMDLVDTLAQKFGIKMASAEKEIAELIDYIAPGWTPEIMRGFLDSSGATFSTRLGFGDLIPLTGMFKAGGDPWREAENFLGPMWSAISQTAGFASNLTRYGAEVVGLKPDLTSFNDILKEAPAAAIRSLADGYTYLSDGRIQNARGSIIDRDVEWYVGVARMLGFYPSSATFQNDLIRMDRQVDAYVKSLKMSYTQSFVKAMIDGDTLAANSIVNMVREHNQEWRGTEYEITNFRGSAMRSYRMHSQPSLLRYRKSAPTNIREDIDRLMEIYGIDPGEI